MLVTSIRLTPLLVLIAARTRPLRIECDLAHFLRVCDSRKFAPAPQIPKPSSAVLAPGAQILPARLECDGITPSSWTNLFNSRPVATSQVRAVLSLLAVAISRPIGTELHRRDFGTNPRRFPFEAAAGQMDHFPGRSS